MPVRWKVDTRGSKTEASPNPAHTPTQYKACALCATALGDAPGYGDDLCGCVIFAGGNCQIYEIGVSMSPFKSALGNVIFNIISFVFAVTIYVNYGPVAAALTAGIILTQRAAIHCWLMGKHGISLR